MMLGGRSVVGRGAGGGSSSPGLMSRMGHQLLKLHDIPAKGGENDIPTEGGNQTVDSSIKCNGMEGRYYVAVDSTDMKSLLCRFLIKYFSDSSITGEGHPDQFPVSSSELSVDR